MTFSSSIAFTSERHNQRYREGQKNCSGGEELEISQKAGCYKQETCLQDMFLHCCRSRVYLFGKYIYQRVKALLNYIQRIAMYFHIYKVINIFFIFVYIIIIKCVFTKNMFSRNAFSDVRFASISCTLSIRVTYIRYYTILDYVTCTMPTPTV